MSDVAETQQRGRPSVFTPEIAEEICNRLAAGVSLRAICRDDGFPAESTVRQWAIEDRNGFFAQYAHARDIGLDCMADQVLSIADKSTAEDYQTARLRFDARRWYLSKLAPKKYGDRVVNEHTGSDGGPVKFEQITRTIVDPQHSDSEDIPPAA